MLTVPSILPLQLGVCGGKEEGRSRQAPGYFFRLFSKFFCFVAPLVKKSFAIAKPHLKSAITTIALDVFQRAVRKAVNDDAQETRGIQEYHGLVR